MRRHKVTLTTVGSNGSAIADNANDRFFAYGLFGKIAIVPGSGQNSGLDVTISEQIGAHKNTLLTATNVGSATVYQVLAQEKDSAGADISGSYGIPWVAGDILIEVSGGNNNATVDVYFYVEDSKVV
jgi:hypothetical protein